MEKGVQAPPGEDDWATDRKNTFDNLRSIAIFHAWNVNGAAKSHPVLSPCYLPTIFVTSASS